MILTSSNYKKLTYVKIPHLRPGKNTRHPPSRMSVRTFRPELHLFLSSPYPSAPLPSPPIPLNTIYGQEFWTTLTTRGPTGLSFEQTKIFLHVSLYLPLEATYYQSSCLTYTQYPLNPHKTVFLQLKT